MIIMVYPADETIRAFNDNQKAKHRKQSLVQRWRALKMPGRLYWRNRVNWRDWESNAVACWKNSTVRIWYYTLAALEAEIEDTEYWQNEKQP